MSRVDHKLVLQAATVAVLVVALGAVVWWLRATAPRDPTPALLGGAQEPLAEGTEIVTCRRRLPDVTAIETEDLEATEPVGRATSTEIIECPSLFDRQVITFVGEVVGDVLRRDGGAWVLMNDDGYALEAGPLPGSRDFSGYNAGLSVWLDDELVDLVGRGGGSNWRGTVLRVRGQVHRADPADGGGLTLRAFAGDVVAAARQLDHTVHWPQVVVAGVLGALALALVGWERVVTRRR